MEATNFINFTSEEAINLDQPSLKSSQENGLEPEESESVDSLTVSSNKKLGNESSGEHALPRGETHIADNALTLPYDSDCSANDGPVGDTASNDTPNCQVGEEESANSTAHDKVEAMEVDGDPEDESLKAKEDLVVQQLDEEDKSTTDNFDINFTRHESVDLNSAEGQPFENSEKCDAVLDSELETASIQPSKEELDAVSSPVVESLTNDEEDLSKEEENVCDRSALEHAETKEQDLEEVKEKDGCLDASTEIVIDDKKESESKGESEDSNKAPEPDCSENIGESTQYLQDSAKEEDPNVSKSSTIPIEDVSVEQCTPVNNETVIEEMEIDCSDKIESVPDVSKSSEEISKNKSDAVFNSEINAEKLNQSSDSKNVETVEESIEKEIGVGHDKQIESAVRKSSNGDNAEAECSDDQPAGQQECETGSQEDIPQSTTSQSGEDRNKEVVSDRMEADNVEAENASNESEAKQTTESKDFVQSKKVNKSTSSKEDAAKNPVNQACSVSTEPNKDDSCQKTDSSLKPSLIPQSVTVATETDTASSDIEPEVCIIPDLKGKQAVLTPRLFAHKPRTEKTPSSASGRPKRSAARAADDKIKSLVLNALEPTSLEEVDEPITQTCSQCKRTKLCRFVVSGQPLCSEDCHSAFQRRPPPRLCVNCRATVPYECGLAWETMDFCKDDCLRAYQTALGTYCVSCNHVVPPTSLGKFCVRFGYEIRQFCAPHCLEEYKKGLKVCSYCQKDISSGAEEGFLAPVGDKGQFKDFCTQTCMGKYERMSGASPAVQDVAHCPVCKLDKTVNIEVQVGPKIIKLCSEICFTAYKFVNKNCEGCCDQCRQYYDKMQPGCVSVFFEDRILSFCCKTCLNVCVLATRKIVQCSMCKVKKYNFDMIKKCLSACLGSVLVCSLHCLSAYQKSPEPRRVNCEFCYSLCLSQFWFPMTDQSARHFCGFACATSYQSRLSSCTSADNGLPTPVGPPMKTSGSSRPPEPASDLRIDTPPINQPNGSISSASVPGMSEVGTILTPVTLPAPQIYQHIVSCPPEMKPVSNKGITCKPYMHNKGTSCRPMPCYKETQTDDSMTGKVLIPVPIPIYIPAPMHMYSSPFPVVTPFPLPIPVPIFIPTTRNSAKGIFKEIKKIQEKIPTDPFEAELLMMAEMVAGEKKQDPTDSESEDGPEAEVGAETTFSPEPVDTSNTFGEDMLQMALKMASELEEPAVDMESVLTSNTITPSAPTGHTVDAKVLYATTDPDEQAHALAMRGRKRPMRGGRGGVGVVSPSKRGRRASGGVPNLAPPDPVQPQRIEVEKPDANMCLKYTFGVNAWRHWVMQKNVELEKAAITNRKIKLFKPELLQLTADELNFSLCLFVKEVKKPNGQEYAPDTIYYLCLGIQQYLFENGRIDNIFTDAYYEKFTDCLDEVAKKFTMLYNDSQFIVTRVEEEHLWESKQLGAHSPHVLLSTLMFFNTKHFNLVTVEEHMQLSFSHIMKHWKRNPNSPGVAKVPGSRNVLLRFYPPQSALEANSRKKKVYEQQENEDNPLRCPVKLYEFYLSKCPESVKTRNDVFYLLPERSCVPDSPVWYSTMALAKEPLMKMLHRIKMVKEINVALLTS